MIVDAGVIFGEVKIKKVDITSKKVNEAKAKIPKFYKEIFPHWTSIKKNLSLVFKINITDIPIFINTSPFSMDNFSDKYICISYQREDNFITSVLHELNHYIFRKKFQDQLEKSKMSQSKIEDLKEVVTVINNVIFKSILKVPDFGWEKHQKDRLKFKRLFLKNNKNLEKTLEEFLLKK